MLRSADAPDLLAGLDLSQAVEIALQHLLHVLALGVAEDADGATLAGGLEQADHPALLHAGV